MKKLLLSFTFLAILLGLTACSGDGKPLSGSSAKSALKKEAFFAKDFCVRSFETGFKEVSDSELEDLAKLKAAGMVDFNVESVIELKEYRYGNYWSGYYTSTEEITHNFANISLTQEGQKLVVKEPTLKREDLVKDFAANKDYKETEPEYMKATYSSSGNPTSEEVAVVAEEEGDSAYIDEVAIATEEESVPEVKSNSGKPNKNAAYEAMKNRVKTEEVNVLLGKFKLIKVKEVKCSEDMFKEGKGSATVIYTFVDKTPFGFVLGSPKENFIESMQVNFVLYQDMGWTVEN